MPFLEELPCILTKDKAIDTLHTYSTMGGQEELSPGTPLEKEEVQGGSGMVEQLGTQEEILRGHRKRTQLLELSPEELLVPASSQEVGVKVHLQLEASCWDKHGQDHGP